MSISKNTEAIKNENKICHVIRIGLNQYLLAYFLYKVIQGSICNRKTSRKNDDVKFLCVLLYI